MFRPSQQPTAANRARLWLLAAFAMSGLLAFSWLARLPSIKAGLGLSTVDLGIVLLVGSVGALATVVSAGPLMTRWGTERLFIVATLLMAVGSTVMGVATGAASMWLLVLGIIVQGMGGALINVTANVESARVERALGRTVIPQFHAVFSAGAVTGSGLGALCSALGIGVAPQFAVVAALGVLLRLAALAGGMVLPQRADEQVATTSPRRSSLAAWREPRTLMIGTLTFATVVAEGAANNWLSVALVDGFAQSESVGGLVLAVMIGSMMLVRVFGATMIDRLGRVLTMRISLSVTAGGLLLFGLAPSLPLAVVGASAWGLGTALIFPIAVGAASDHPLLAPGRVAVLSAITTVGALVAPPLLGIAAGSLGVRHALLIVAVVTLVGLVTASSVEPLAGRRKPDEAVGRDAVPSVPAPGAA
ncbi:MAG: MFS transporter [Propionicimonas sp.]